MKTLFFLRYKLYPPTACTNRVGFSFHRAEFIDTNTRGYYILLSYLLRERAVFIGWRARGEKQWVRRAA